MFDFPLLVCAPDTPVCALVASTIKASMGPPRKMFVFCCGVCVEVIAGLDGTKTAGDVLLVVLLFNSVDAADVVSAD